MENLFYCLKAHWQTLMYRWFCWPPLLNYVWLYSVCYQIYIPDFLSPLCGRWNSTLCVRIWEVSPWEPISFLVESTEFQCQPMRTFGTVLVCHSKPPMLHGGEMTSSTHLSPFFPILSPMCRKSTNELCCVCRRTDSQTSLVCNKKFCIDTSWPSICFPVMTHHVWMPLTFTTLGTTIRSSKLCWYETWVVFPGIFCIDFSMPFLSLVCSVACPVNSVQKQGIIVPDPMF